MPRPPNRSSAISRRVRRADRCRRGGVYVLVLGVATMIAVVGLGAIAISRGEIKSTRAASDWARAEALAEGGVETAIAVMNTNTDWRTGLTSGSRVSIGTMGGGEGGYSVVDTTDGDLSRGSKEPVTVYGYGRVGEATRVFSLDCQYRPPPVLDVLKYGLYASGSVTVGTASVTGAPLGTPGLTVNSLLTANVRIGSLSNSGSIIGEVRTGQTAVTSFSDGSLSSLSARAVTISYSSIPGGNISKALLSSGVNPYGSVSSAGIYFIRVPLLSTLTITNSRINATLIVELALTSRLVITGANNISPSDATLPTLVINSIATSTVRIGGTTGTLDESVASANFNPTSTPYQGVTDSDKTDSYPSEVRGVVHSISTLASIQVDSSAKIVGALICEGSVSLDGGATIAYDPQLLQDPPAPYRTGAAGMAPVAGTWKWQVLP